MSKSKQFANLVCNVTVNVEPNDDIEVIRVEFRDAGWIDVPVDGRTLHVVEYESAFVVVEQQEDDNLTFTEKHAIAHFPVDAVRSIVRMTVKR